MSAAHRIMIELWICRCLSHTYNRFNLIKFFSAINFSLEWIDHDQWEINIRADSPVHSSGSIESSWNSQKWVEWEWKTEYNRPFGCHTPDWSHGLVGSHIGNGNRVSHSVTYICHKIINSTCEPAGCLVAVRFYFLIDSHRASLAHISPVDRLNSRRRWRREEEDEEHEKEAKTRKATGMHILKTWPMHTQEPPQTRRRCNDNSLVIGLPLALLQLHTCVYACAENRKKSIRCTVGCCTLHLAHYYMNFSASRNNVERRPSIRWKWNMRGDLLNSVSSKTDVVVVVGMSFICHHRGMLFCWDPWCQSQQHQNAAQRRMAHLCIRTFRAWALNTCAEA